MRQQGARPRSDAVIAEIATRQHGVLSVMQLHAAGADSSAIKRRVAAGRLHRVHRGVYAVGHARLSNEGRWMAAVLTSGTVRSSVIEVPVSSGESFAGRVRRPST